MLCLACGEVEQEYTHQDKLATIAILEDSRDMRAGEILRYLKDTDPEIRVKSLRAIGRIAGPDAAPSLAPLLNDTNRVVRKEAAFALGQIGGTSALLAVVKRIKDEKSIDVKCTLLEALGKMDDLAVVATLINYFDHPDPQIRESVAFAMSRLGGHNQTDKLVELSRDSIAEVRAMATFAMMRTGDSTAFQRLRWCLKDSVPLVREYAALAVGSLGDSTGLKDLTDRLRREKYDRVKVNIIRSIARVGNKKALKSLLNVIAGKESIHVRAEAIEAIGKLKLGMALSKVKPFISDENRTIRGKAIVAVAQLDPDGFLSIATELMEHADWYDKTRIAEGLAEIGTTEAFRIFEQLLSDEDGRVRRIALSLVSSFPDVDVVPYIEKGLDDGDLAVNTTAVMLVAEDSISGLIEKLENLYSKHATDKNPDVRFAIVEAFMEWVDSVSPNSSMIDVFNQALDDMDYQVRQIAVQANKKIGIDNSASLGVYRTDISEQNYPDKFARFKSNPTAIIKTNRGDITIKLLYDLAPKTVNNFVDLARSGFYDEKTWHRVIPSFVIQDGCPRGDGWGGTDYTIRCEYTDTRFERGIVGMAHAGKDTGGSQFFICHTSRPNLDGRYTVFGRVTSGMRAVDRIEVGDSIRTVEIVADGQTQESE